MWVGENLKFHFFEGIFIFGSLNFLYSKDIEIWKKKIRKKIDNLSIKIQFKLSFIRLEDIFH